MNKSMLCASILLLTPLSLAVSFQDFSFDFGVGQRCVTIGDPKDTKKNVFGTQTETGTAAHSNTELAFANNPAPEVTKNADGIARSVGYCAPMATGSLAFKVGNNIKLSGEIHASSSDSLYVSDVWSDVASVNFTLQAVPIATQGADITANALITSTNGGRNDLQVSPKFEVGLKGEWQFGEEANGATLGVALFRAQDEFTYLAETPSSSFDTQFTQTTTSTVDTGEITNTPASTFSNETYALSGTETEKYDESGFWVGAVGSATSRINDSISLRVNAGYYMRNFDSSKGDSNGVKFLVRDTDATMSSFNVAFALNR